MTLKNIDIPFNKDAATIFMAKEAVSSLEGLFEIIEREGISNEDRTAWLAGHVDDIYRNWVRKFPKAEGLIMDNFTATGLAEGFIEPEGKTEDERLEQIADAWQHLVNTGLVWQLQGHFGRTAQMLIDEGIIEPAQGEAA